MYDPCNFAHLFPTMVKTVFYIYAMKVQMRSPSPFFANIHVRIQENYLIVSIVDHYKRRKSKGQQFLISILVSKDSIILIVYMY